MKVYLVCESSGGAHEYDGVYSVWSSREAAIAEADRLLLEPDYNRCVTLCEADLDRPFSALTGEWGEPCINLAPHTLEEYKLNATS